jgi:hypothetical protein
MRLVEALNLLDTQALGEPQTGNFTALAVFRFLLFHTWWTGEQYGWVADAWTAQEKIATAMGCHRNTVYKALGDLEEAKMITRRHRPAGQGKGRLPDAIFIDWVATYSSIGVRSVVCSAIASHS